MEDAGRSWTIADARARFGKLVDKALSDGPQIVTRKGRETVVVVSVEDWNRKTVRKGTLADFLAASPLRESGLEIERLRDPPREIDPWAG